MADRFPNSQLPSLFPLSGEVLPIERDFGNFGEITQFQEKPTLFCQRLRYLEAFTIGGNNRKNRIPSLSDSVQLCTLSKVACGGAPQPSGNATRHGPSTSMGAGLAAATKESRAMGSGAT